METQRGKLIKSRYGNDAAVYQPSRAEMRRTISLVFLLLTALLVGLATRAHADQGADHYQAQTSGSNYESTTTGA